MKANKEKSLSVSAKRELEVLSRYYRVDYEKQVITIPVHYKTVSDIIKTHIGTKNHPVIDDSVLENLSKIAHSIPEPFKISVEAKIDNYEGYQPKVIMDSLQDSLEIFNYNIKKQRNSNNIKMSLLIAVGVVIFAWLFYFCSFKLFAEEIIHNTVHEIIYTIACVLLWEGVYILFLPDKQYNSVSYSILHQINEISLLDKKDKVLFKKNLEELKVDWVHEGKWQKRCRRTFLMTATGYLCLALCGLPGIINLFASDATKGISLPLAIISILLALLLCATSFSTLSYYYGQGPLKRWVLPLNIASLAVVSANLILHIVNALIYQNTSIFWIVINSLLVIISAFGIWGAIILSRKRKQNNQQ